ncbi:MAG TPA: cation:proton antiporter [Anaerolineae bacterium]|jgi:Kef-type K+ transport system membrane component KefB
MSPSLQLIFLLAILIAATKSAGYISMRLKQPAVLGELLAGLLLGPSLLGIFGWQIFSSGHTREVVLELAEVGVILLMFLAGLEVDTAEMLHSGRVALSAGVLGVIVPLGLGIGLALLFQHSLNGSIFIGLILTATSVSISAQTLLEMGSIKTRTGVILLGAAVVDDVLGILLLSAFLAVASSGIVGGFVGTLASMVLFFAVTIAFGIWVLPKLTHRIHQLPVSEGVISWAIVATLLFAFSAEAFGQVAAITGAFMAGVFFGRTRLRREITRGIHTVAYAFFVPIFLVSIGLQVDAHAIDGGAIIFMLLLTIVAIVGKVAGAGLGARIATTSWADSLRIGVGMISRGEVGLIIAAIGLKDGLIDESIFTSVVMMVLLTTLITPLLLRRLMPRE